MGEQGEEDSAPPECRAGSERECENSPGLPGLTGQAGLGGRDPGTHCSEEQRPADSELPPVVQGRPKHSQQLRQVPAPPGGREQPAARGPAPAQLWGWCRGSGPGLRQDGPPPRRGEAAGGDGQPLGEGRQGGPDQGGLQRSDGNTGSRETQFSEYQENIQQRTQKTASVLNVKYCLIKIVRIGL